MTLDKDIADNTVSTNVDSTEIFANVRYIFKSNNLITESLQQGYDITQLPNGDIIRTKVKIIDICHSWNAQKNKMVVRHGANNSNKEIVNNVQYICNSNTLITDSLKNGFDIVQFANGDVVRLETKTISTCHSWDAQKNKMVARFDKTNMS